MAELTPDEKQRLSTGLHYLASLVDADRTTGTIDVPVIPDPVEPEPDPVEPSGPVTATGATLAEARSEFARLYPDVVRDDCDPNPDGGWTCSSANITSGPQPKPDPVVTPDPIDPQPKPDPIAGDAILVEVPGKAENRYKFNANASSNLATYRDAGGALKQVLVYYNEQRQTCIVRRDFPSGEFETPINIHSKLGNSAPLEYDNHNVAAVGVAQNGKIFVCANHHVDPLSMAVTSRPLDLNSFAPFDRRDMGGDDTDRVTYPSFFYHRGFLCLSYREQEVGGGNSRFRWLLKRYNHRADRWVHMADLNRGSHLRLYVSNIATSPDGNRIHCAALWRDDSQRDNGTIHQHDYFHLYSDNGVDWFQYSNSGPVEVPLPVVWTGDGKSTVPENIWTTPPDPIPNGAGSIAIDAQGFPHMLMDIRGGQLVHHWFDGNEWQEARDILNTSTEDVFAIGEKVCAVSHSGDRVYFHELGNNTTTVLLAEGYVSRVFNVHMDKTALMQGWLSVMLTKNESHPPRSTHVPMATDMFVMNIPLDRLAGFSEPFKSR